MLKVEEKLKNLYKSEKTLKNIHIDFPGIHLDNSKISYESMKITESICENEELTFGDCNASEFSIVLAEISEDLTEKTFSVTQILNGDPKMSLPLGTYTVKSCKRQSDRRFKEITAYDDMIKLDKDVTVWYNSRNWPISLKDLRESLLVFCNISYESQNLPNDSIMVNKTLRPSSMNGRDVMKRICELNGGFGHITRQNKFKVITLAGLGLYPSETLYPSEDLFPAESGEIIDGSSSGAAYRPESTYEDYICRAIDQLRIRTGEDDTGVVVNNGTSGTNEYIMQGNFLISDKSAAELTEIAEALFLVIKNKYYRPHNMVITGLPYLEVGDSVLINTKDDVIESFIFSRTLSGIQALKDSISATGYEYRQNKIGLDVQISQLEQTTSDVQNDIEEIEEFNGQTTINLKKLENGILAEVARATAEEGELSARINITAEEVSSKVTQGEVVSEINQSAEAIVLKANRLIVDSKDFKLDGNGNASFKGDVDGANITAKWAFSFYDKQTGNKIEVMMCDGDFLYIGRAAKNIIFDQYAHFENGVNVNGAFATDEVLATLVDCDEVRTLRINSNSHTHSTDDVYWTDNGNGNCVFAGTSLRAASTSWTLDNFERKTSSDFRLKKDILSADKKIVDFLKKLKVKTYRFKDSTENQKIHTGVLAQEVISAMEASGMNNSDYDIVEEYNTRHYKDEGMYTGEKAYRVNYQELFSMLLYGWQEQQKEIENLKKEIKEIKKL